jgi:hypothetical protein
MASAALLPDAEADVRALGKASQRQPDAGHRRCQRAVEPCFRDGPPPLKAGPIGCRQRTAKACGSADVIRQQASRAR